MPILGSNTEPLPAKVLVIAPSGFGKTGGLASLVQAGYKLHHVDFDNGWPILLSKVPKQFYSNVEYETFTDPFKKVGSRIIPVAATAWDKGTGQIETYCKKNPTTEHVVSIDSLTHLSNAAMRWVLHQNNRLSEAPYQSDWGAAQKMIEGVLAYLFSTEVKCNVVMNAHGRYFGGEPEDPEKRKAELASSYEPVQGFPISLGKAIAPIIGTYFNDCLIGKIIGSGPTALRKYYTAPTDLFTGKSSAPDRVKAEYPLSTGLAQFFADLRGTQAPSALKSA